jgi:hypothetical protein
MIIVDCEQGKPEWLAARCGIPTASEFGKILTSTGKVSTQAGGYMNKLLAEWMMGEASPSYASEWMERGNEVEAEARDFYSFDTGQEVETIGFALKDERGLVGCSPDCLVGDAGGLEIKCPSPAIHVEYLLAGKVPTKYVPQVQGCLWVTGREWWDFLSYHPELPPLKIRVARDEQYITSLAAEVERFIIKMLARREQFIEMGYKGESND